VPDYLQMYELVTDSEYVQNYLVIQCCWLDEELATAQTYCSSLKGFFGELA